MMVSKITIIERYLADLRNLIPDTLARQQRIELLEAELEAEKQVKNLFLFSVVCRLLDEAKAETMRIGYWEGEPYAKKIVDSGIHYPDHEKEIDIPLKP